MGVLLHFPTGEALAPVIPLWGGTVNAVPDTAKGTEVARRTESVVIAAWTPAGRPQHFNNNPRRGHEGDAGAQDVLRGRAARAEGHDGRDEVAQQGGAAGAGGDVLRGARHGVRAGGVLTDCPRCGGDGEITVNPSPIRDPQHERPAPCPDCYGSGIGPGDAA